jgi:uncharacterized protein
MTSGPSETSRALYIDTSALAKMAWIEAETQALRTRIQGVPLVTSTLAEVELPRAAKRVGPDAVAAAETVLTVVGLIPMGTNILRRAARLEPAETRSLDAIHLATALNLWDADKISAMVAYDARLLQAAKLNGLPSESPS